MTMDSGGAGAAPVAEAVPVVARAAPPAVADDVDDTEGLLVEEISIDGMCGVY
jgi:mycofactocin precursor